MNSFINLIFGPLGQAMPILKKYGRLFENSDFVELNDELYESFYRKKGMPSERVYVLKSSIDNGIPVDKDFEVVLESEMKALVQASQLVLSTANSQKQEDNPEKIRQIIDLYCNTLIEK